MQIKFSNIRPLDSPLCGKHFISLEEAEQVVGDLEITFGHRGAVKNFTRKDLSIPVFVTEAKMFLSDVFENKYAVWRIYFAPFVKGRLESGDVVLYTGLPGDPEGGILDALTEGGLAKFLSLLNELASEYGELKNAPL